MQAAEAVPPGFVLVLEGAAKAAPIPAAQPGGPTGAESGAGPVRPGEVRVVQAAARGTTRSWPWCANCPGGAWS